MISLVTAIFCSATACIPVQVPFADAPTPAACERAIREIEPGFLADNPGFSRQSMRCDAPGEGA